MTPISEMTNEQLDRWIAEKKKLTVCECVGHYCNCGFGVYPYHPCTDPRYAFELLEEMPMGCVTINSLSGIFGTTNKWEIIMGFDDGEEDHIIHNVSLCRAICEAWAEWMLN